MADVLILSDLLVPDLEENKRGTTESILYRTIQKQNIALGATPYATLLGPAILGSSLERAGHSVRILECAFRAPQRLNLIVELKKKYRYILLSSTFIELESQLNKCVSLVRELSPQSAIIIGGPTLLTNLNVRRIPDYFILGEGEEALPQLINALENGVSNPSIPGVGFFRDGKEILTPQRMLHDLDLACQPSWGLVRRRPDEYYSIYTQRGCPWRCAFCSYPANEGFKLRTRSITSVIDEVQNNYDKFGIFRYVISDSTFTFPQDRCLELLKAFQKLPFKIEWIAFGRVDDMSDTMAEALKNSGCRGLFFGCDSGDPRILKAMNKRFTREQIINGTQILRKTGVPFTSSWIVGFPGETVESIKNTWDAIQTVRADENLVHTFSVLDNSPVSMRLEKFSIQGSRLNWEHTSMTSHKAKRWTEWIVQNMLREGIHFGSTFDRAWLRTLQLSDDEVSEFFNVSEEVNFYRARYHLKPHNRKLKARSLEDAEMSLRLSCEMIWSRSKQHPVYDRTKESYVASGF